MGKIVIVEADRDNEELLDYRICGKDNLEFMECDTCRAKVGSPTLCKDCLHNRWLIGVLNAD